MGYVDLLLDGHTLIVLDPGAVPLKTILTTFALSAAATGALAQSSPSDDLARRNIERRAIGACRSSIMA